MISSVYNNACLTQLKWRTCLCVGLYLSITSIYYCHTTGINKGTISLLFEGISTAVVKVCRKYFGVKKFAEHSMHWLQIFPDHSLRRKAATGSCFKIWTRYMFLQPPLSDDGVSFMFVFCFLFFDWSWVAGLVNFHHSQLHVQELILRATNPFISWIVEINLVQLFCEEVSNKMQPLTSQTCGEFPRHCKLKVRSLLYCSKKCPCCRHCTVENSLPPTSFNKVDYLQFTIL